MPNGKPGDHPYTDILVLGHSEYGDPVDSLVKELSKMPGFSAVSNEVSNILWDNSPAFEKEKEARIRQALLLLTSIKQRLSGSSS
jgi:hypothetical protein